MTQRKAWSVFLFLIYFLSFLASFVPSFVILAIYKIQIVSKHTILIKKSGLDNSAAWTLLNSILYKQKFWSGYALVLADASNSYSWSKIFELIDTVSRWFKYRVFDRKWPRSIPCSFLFKTFQFVPSLFKPLLLISPFYKTIHRKRPNGVIADFAEALYIPDMAS